MGQQVADAAGRECRQAFKDVLHVGVHVMAVQSRRVQQAHHRGSRLPRPRAPGKQPIFLAKRNWRDLVLHLVVIDRHRTIVRIVRQRAPASQAVINRFGCRTVVRYALPLRQQPGMQGANSIGRRNTFNREGVDGTTSGVDV